MASEKSKQFVPTEADGKPAAEYSEGLHDVHDGEKGGVLDADADYSGAVKKTSKEEIALVRKLDWRIMPTLWAMYFLNYVSALRFASLLTTTLTRSVWRSWIATPSPKPGLMAWKTTWGSLAPSTTRVSRFSLLGRPSPESPHSKI